MPHGDLQRHVPRRPARHLLSRPARSGFRERTGAHPPALLDQHVPDLVAGASLSHDRAQRRDQHAARQQQLDGGAAGVGVVAEIRCRHLEAVADLLRGSIRHRLFRQRSRILDHGRLLAGPCDDDDDSRSLGGQSAYERGTPRVLRIQRRADGAMGRSGGNRIHRRPADRRHPRPQRIAAGALRRHPRRPHHHGVGSGRAANSRGGDRHQVAVAAGQDAIGRSRGRPAYPRRRAQGDAGEEPSIRQMAGAHADRIGGLAGLGRSGADLEPTIARSSASVRIHPGGSQDPDDADGGDRRRSRRLHGQRHADLRPVRPAETAIHLFQAELRPGNQPADRPDPRGIGDEPGFDHRAAAKPVRPRRHVEHQAAGSAAADSHQCRPGKDPLDLGSRRVAFQVADTGCDLAGRGRHRRHGGRHRRVVQPSRRRGARRHQHHHPVGPPRRRRPHSASIAARLRGRASSLDPRGPAYLGRSRRRIRRAA